MIVIIVVITIFIIFIRKISSYIGSISFSETKKRVSFRGLSSSSQKPDVQVNVDANTPAVMGEQPYKDSIEVLKPDELKALERGRHICRLVGEALRVNQARSHLHTLSQGVPFIVYSLQNHDVPSTTRRMLAFKYGAAGFATDLKQLLHQFQHVFGADEGDVM